MSHESRRDFAPTTNSTQIQNSFNDNSIRMYIAIDGSQQRIDQGIEKLSALVGPANASYNSAELSKTTPLCYANTRASIQTHVLSWLDDRNSNPSRGYAMWMYGPAGAGKTTIARTLAQRCHDEKRLAASFFFSRTRQGRDTHKHLVPALAYDLHLNVDGTSKHVVDAVLKNPRVADDVLKNPSSSTYDLKTQMDDLFVKPLLAALKPLAEPLLVIIDGLDECEDLDEDDSANTKEWTEEVSQPYVTVLKTLLKGVDTVNLSLPHSVKILVTSRTDYRIRDFFDRQPSPDMVERLELDDRWNPSADIREYLTGKLGAIKHTDTIFKTAQYKYGLLKWPSNDDIDKLVTLSSGQFIYASVVIGYIASTLRDSKTPVERLQIVLRLQSAEDSGRRYARLDRLFRHIFSRIPDREKPVVLEILSLKHLYSMTTKHEPFSIFLSEILQMDMMTIKAHLRHLESVLHWEDKGNFELIHASLSDFVSDASRSGDYYIYSKAVTASVIERLRTLLEEQSNNMKHLRRILPVIQHYSKHMAPADAIDMYKTLSTFNVISVWENIRPGDEKYRQIKATANHIQWLLVLSETRDLPKDAAPFVQHWITPIRDWVCRAMQDVGLQQLQQSEGIDLWPFFAVRSWTNYDQYPIKLFAWGIQSMLDICQVTTLIKEDIVQDAEACNDILLLWQLIPKIVHSVDIRYGKPIFGEHHFSSYDYTLAFARVCRYLIQVLPNESLGELLRSSPGVVTIKGVPSGGPWAAKAFMDFLIRMNHPRAHRSQIGAGIGLFLVYMQSRFIECDCIDQNTEEVVVLQEFESNQRRRVWKAKQTRGGKMLRILCGCLSKMVTERPDIIIPGSPGFLVLLEEAEQSPWFGIVSDFWNPRLSSQDDGYAAYASTITVPEWIQPEWLARNRYYSA